MEQRDVLLTRTLNQLDGKAQVQQVCMTVDATVQNIGFTVVPKKGSSTLAATVRWWFSAVV